MRMTTRCAVACAVGLLAAPLFAAPAAAQEAPNLRGRVLTPAGAPLPGVAVRIEGTETDTRTDERGAFAFANVRTGVQVLHFRRIGYLPSQLPVHVPERSDTLAVTLVPMTPALDTVRVVAQLHVLAGLVLDDKLRPIAGATVDLVGSKQAETTTDSAGSFVFTSVRSGKVIVRARKPEYEMALHSVNLEDWRGLVLTLDPLEEHLRPSKRLEYSGYGNAVEFTWKETQQRLNIAHGSRATIVTREELAPVGAMTLGQALRYTRSGSLLAADLQYAGPTICVVEDGRFFVGPTTLDLYGADDIAFLELYPPGTEVSGSLAQYARGGGCPALRLPGRTRTSGVFYAVIWMR